MVIDGIEYLDNVNWQFVREHQDEQLKTAKLVAQICEENGLRYFLDGGTLLGAFRHGGFIPWDDDIDFAMPRPDFERLLAIVRNTSALKILNWDEDEDCCLPMTKIMRMDCDGEMSHNPSAIDVFVMDAAPQSILIARIQMYFFILLYNILIYRKRRSASTHPVVSAVASALLPKDNRKVRALFSKFLFKKSDWRGDSYIGVRYEPSDIKYFVRFDVYDNGTVRKMKFCDAEFRVPVKAEDFLTQFYGNWKSLPPIQQRVPKHENDAAWFYSKMR